MIYRFERTFGTLHALHGGPYATAMVATPEINLSVLVLIRGCYSMSGWQAALFSVTFFALPLWSMPISAEDSIVVAQGSADRVPLQPQAWASSQGLIHIVYGIGTELHYCRYDGVALSPPARIAQVPNLSLGLRRGPRIAEANNTIVVTAIGGPKGKGQDGDVLAFRSLDGGISWQGPTRVNDVNASAREGLHALSASPDGQFWSAWLDLRNQKTELYASRSLDGGANWQTNVLAYRSPDKSICECCHPSILAEGGSVHLLFRNLISGNRDMYLVSSRDDGKSWSDAVRLGKDHWQLNACPMDGGMLTQTPKGIQAVFRRAGKVYRADAEMGTERFLGVGEQPWICSIPQGTAIVWTTARQGDLMLVLGDSAPSLAANNARDPVIVWNEHDRNWGVLLWEDHSPQRTQILAKRITLPE